MTRFSYGGYFNYEQYNIYRTVSELKNIIEYNWLNPGLFPVPCNKYIAQTYEKEAGKKDIPQPMTGAGCQGRC